jgi:hypothetical protein
MAFARVVNRDVGGKSGGAKDQQEEKVRSSKHAAFLDREKVRRKFGLGDPSGSLSIKTGLLLST